MFPITYSLPLSPTGTWLGRQLYVSHIQNDFIKCCNRLFQQNAFHICEVHAGRESEKNVEL